MAQGIATRTEPEDFDRWMGAESMIGPG